MSNHVEEDSCIVCIASIYIVYSVVFFPSCGGGFMSNPMEEDSCTVCTVSIYL